MKATFVELPPFARHRARYLDDDEFRELQQRLMDDPEAGVVIQGSGGLRKLRFGDGRRGKGKRGGLRIIYFRWIGGSQFWLFTLFDKDEVADLTQAQRKVLHDMVKAELARRSQ
jgi:hypothetical protein